MKYDAPVYKELNWNFHNYQESFERGREGEEMNVNSFKFYPPKLPFKV